MLSYVFFFFKQKTAYEIYQCDWSSDVCSSDLPGDITFTLTDAASQTKQFIQQLKSTTKSDNTCIARFHKLKPDTRYRYTVSAGSTKCTYKFTTSGPSIEMKIIRIVYGYGYMPGENQMSPGTSVFTKMYRQNADEIGRASCRERV